MPVQRDASEPPFDAAVPSWEELTPPPLFLETAGGRQEAHLGSYCTTLENQMTCVDRAYPGFEDLLVVHPGERATFILEGGSLVTRESGCMPCLPPSVRVLPMGCSRLTEVTSFEMSEDVPWTIDLPPGAYELEANVTFEADSGLTGGFDAHFGLLVDPDREVGFVPRGDYGAQCSSPTEPDDDAGI